MRITLLSQKLRAKSLIMKHLNFSVIEEKAGSARDLAFRTLSQTMTYSIFITDIFLSCLHFNTFMQN